MRKNFFFNKSYQKLYPEGLLLGKCFITICLLISFLLAGAQERTITGKVTDGSGSPLPGVTIVKKGTTSGTITKNDGDYSIKVLPNAVLVFSFVGMETQEILIQSQTTLNVSLKVSSVGLDEVIAIGYGTQKRSHFAGASAGINTVEEKIDEIPVESLDKALQGRLAGVHILNTEEQVGLSPEITIRGLSTLSAGKAPLIVIDGLPIVGGSVNDVNMGDVMRVEVLKDAASSAIYGSRGANGVIIITTKTGTTGKPSFNIKLQTGMSNVIKYFDQMEYDEFAQVQWYRTSRAPWETTYLSQGLEIPGDPLSDTKYIPFDLWFSNKLNPATQKPYSAAGAAYYNMYKLNQLSNSPTPQESVTNNNANNTDLFFSAQGGNDKISYYMSADYKYIEGVYIENNSSSISLNSKVQAKLSDKVKVEFNLKPNYRNVNIANNYWAGVLRWMTHPLYHNEYTLKTGRRVSDGGYVENWKGIGDYVRPQELRNMWLMNDDFSDYVYDNKGNKVASQQGWGITAAVSAYTQAKETTDNRENYSLNGNMALDWELLRNLTFRTSFGIYANLYANDSYLSSFFQSGGQVNSGRGRATYRSGSSRNIVNENTLSYKYTLGKHQFNFLAGFSAEAYKDEFLVAGGDNYSDDIIKSLNYAGLIMLTSVNNGTSEESLLSFFGRFNYNFKEKYLLSLVARTDGSSQFGPDNRWGSFPSASFAWRIAEEKFMKNVRFINDLRLRISYGVTGNNRIARYSYVTGINSVKYYLGNELVNGYAANSPTLGNSDIGWEQLNAANLGLSISMFNNKLNLNIDAYSNKNKSLLLQNPIVDISGHTSEWINIGKVENKGIELDLNALIVKLKNFQWNASFNIARNANKLLDYGGTDEQFYTGYRFSQYRLKVGRPVGEMWGFKEKDEIWKTAQELADGKTLGLAPSYAVLGDAKYVDVNGDGKITDEDKTVLGSPHPDFEWGLTNQFSFKQFDMSFSFQGSHGNQVWNMDWVLANLTGRWTNDGTYIDAFHGDKPYVNSANATRGDLFIENASFVAMRDFTLGYKLPFAKSNLRIFFSGRNLLYLMSSNYNGINPEHLENIGGGGDLIRGQQNYKITPLTRSCTFGIDVKF
jgi:TonB-dependent starch-binding outer membrane protein SusC